MLKAAAGAETNAIFEDDFLGAGRRRGRAVRKLELAPGVTVNLWANLQADIKLPVLLLIAFILGWLPTWLIVRAKLWSLQRRFEALERQHAPPIAASPTQGADDPAI